MNTVTEFKLVSDFIFQNLRLVIAFVLSNFYLTFVLSLSVLAIVISLIVSFYKRNN